MFIFEAEVIPPTFIYLFIYFSDILLFLQDCLIQLMILNVILAVFNFLSFYRLQA